MASRDIEKMQFPVLDMLRNEQKEKKNVSVEKDDFSEVVKADSKKNRVRKFRTNLEKTMRFIRGHFLIEIHIFDYISSTCFEKVTANFESFLIIKRFHRWSKSDPQFRNIRSAVPRLNILKSWKVSQELERESKYFYSIRSDERFEFICRQSRIQKRD